MQQIVNCGSYLIYSYGHDVGSMVMAVAVVMVES
jgi:hypothetical protein